MGSPPSYPETDFPAESFFDVYVTIDLPTEHSRWEERDSVQHYCFHAVVTRVGEETVALHLKYAQFIFTIASDE